MMYLLYARSGREFEVADAIRAKGCEAYCARKMVFIRKGKKRRPEAEVFPMLPNYLFADIPADLYLDVLSIKYLASTTMPLCKGDRKYLDRFMSAAEAEYRKAESIQHNQQQVCEYKAGQALKTLDGRFTDRMLTFLEMVERTHDMFPKIRAEVEMMGRMTVVELDPLSVKAAE